MNDLIKIISVVAICAVASFFLVKNFGQPKALTQADILASSNGSTFPRIGDYIPASWKGESANNKILLADNTVIKDTERASLAELQEASKKALAKQTRDNTILTASAVSAGSYGFGASSHSGLMLLVIILMIAILVILSRLISKKKRVLQSRQSFFFPEASQPYRYQ